MTKYQTFRIDEFDITLTMKIDYNVPSFSLNGRDFDQGTIIVMSEF